MNTQDRIDLAREYYALESNRLGEMLSLIYKSKLNYSRRVKSYGYNKLWKSADRQAGKVIKTRDLILELEKNNGY